MGRRRLSEKKAKEHEVGYIRRVGQNKIKSVKTVTDAMQSDEMRCGARVSFLVGLLSGPEKAQY